MRQKVSSWKGRKVSATLSPSESGCLDISLVNPAVGEIAIDGGPFREVSRGVRGWSVAAGKHEVRVRNVTAKRDDTFKVDVQAGKACSLIVWE